MTVSAAQVKELRDKTGVAMLACKKALEEANGDMAEAVELLRKRGAAKAAEVVEIKGQRTQCASRTRPSDLFNFLLVRTIMH